MPPFAAAASVRTSEPMPVCECPYMTLLRYVARRRQVFSLTSAASRLRISLLGAHAPLVHPRKEGITVILDATFPLSSWRSAGQRAARAALSLPGPSPGVSTCRDSSRRVVADPQMAESGDRGTFPHAGPRQRERNEQRSHRADGATVSRCARPVVSKATTRLEWAA